MMESPTGSGKTVLGLALARQLQREFGFSEGWVALRCNLLAQQAGNRHAAGLFKTRCSRQRLNGPF
jgi:superfamily II DNA or RNA helicase